MLMFFCYFFDAFPVCCTLFLIIIGQYEITLWQAYLIFLGPLHKCREAFALVIEEVIKIVAVFVKMKFLIEK